MKNLVKIHHVFEIVDKFVFPPIEKNAEELDSLRMDTSHHQSSDVQDELRTIKKIESESKSGFIIKVIRALTYSLVVDNIIGDREKIKFMTDEHGPEFRLFISYIHS